MEETMRPTTAFDVEIGGKSGSSHTASEWKYVAPETNGARVMKLLCEKSGVR
jgi:hypothetical protein